MKKLISFFSLFGSLGTLLCCALPVLFVTLGMGAAFASLTATFPQIIWLTERKEILFVITATLLISSYFLIKKSEKKACPIYEKQAEACRDSKGVSKILFWTTVAIYIIGLSFSYIIPRILYDF